VSLRRPSLAEFSLCCEKPTPLGVSLTRFGRGIDNAHIDIFLSPRFREMTEDTVRKLILEEVRAGDRRTPARMVRSADLAAFRGAYATLSETALEGYPSSPSVESCFLLQLALLKFLLQTVDRECLRLQRDLKGALQSDKSRDSGRSFDLHEQIVALSKHGHAISHRVLGLLFSQVRTLEKGHLKTLRASVIRQAWPLPEAAWFNPVLLIPNPGDVEVLSLEYPIAALGEDGDMTWLSQTNKCLATAFKPYLPGWTQIPAFAIEARKAQDSEPHERQDQGQLRGFLAVEILLGRFVVREEYLRGRDSWLDVPGNLRRFLDQQGKIADDGVVQSWNDPRWTDFRHAIADDLYRCLDSQGLVERIQQLYAVSKAYSHLGKRHSKRRLTQRLGALHIDPNAGAILRVLDKATSLIRGARTGDRMNLVSRFLVDFLILRRDLKLAYQTYQAMDQVRLLEQTSEAQLSRSNGSLYDFPCRDEISPATRRIRSHAVVKADLRGSTRITDELLAKGLNPASHFSLNFFNPVNKLLGEFEAEKVFVEGDAVIIAVYDLEQEGSGSAVARACCLARKIIHVVNMQNVVNRRHGLPELELGLGIAFSRREPNFLFDEGQKIMISGAINRADRLSSNSAILRAAGFKPSIGAFRVDVLHDAAGCHKPGSGLDLLSYNVNGVKLEEQAFLKLQEEIPSLKLYRPGGEFGFSLFFICQYTDTSGHNHWIHIRHAPVREWDGERVGVVEPQRRHYFEMVVDEGLSMMLRNGAETEPLPLGGNE